MQSRPRNILVMHALRETSRQTTIEHIKSFKSLLPNDNVQYIHFGEPRPSSISDCTFDIFIINYDFLNYRFSPLWNYVKNRYRDVALRSNFRIAIAQDDFWANEYLDDWVIDWKINRVLTPLDSNLEILYRKSFPDVEFKNVLTGYVTGELNSKPQYPKLENRKIDVGQRVRFMPANLGRYAQEKAHQAEKFGQLAREAGFEVDVSTNPEDSIIGSKWFDFLQNTKFTVSMKGGASLNDPKGKIFAKVQSFRAKHPNATFDEIENKCFPGMDMKRVYSAISPRIFEAAIAGTCQILKEENYLDILKPWVDFIPLKEDFSNVEEVFNAMRDIQMCQEISNNAFNTLVKSGMFHYSKFVNLAVSDLEFENAITEELFIQLENEIASNRLLQDKYGVLTHDLIYSWLHDIWLTRRVSNLRKLQNFILNLNQLSEMEGEKAIDAFAKSDVDAVVLRYIIELGIATWVASKIEEIQAGRWFSRQVWQWRAV